MNCDLQNRSPEVIRQPDKRLLVTRIYDVLNFIPKDPDKLLADVWLEWGTPDEDFPECRLTKQFVSGQNGPFRNPCQEPPILTRVYDEISATGETQVGEPSITYDQYNNKIVTIKWLQFSAGTPVYQTPGVSTAPAPNADAVLKEQIDTDDGDLRTITRVYTTGGVLDDQESLRFGGKVIQRDITSLNEPIATPSGYTPVANSTYFVRGLPVYKATFVKANGGGGSGTGGVIFQGFTNNQGGDIAFDPTNPDGATGEVICTTRYVSQPSVTTNPITQPTGFVLWALDVSYETGYIVWESKASYGGGNPISVEVRGDAGGALFYTVSQNDADGTTIPAYPGSGTAYNINTTHTRDNGFWRNQAVWQKPPATVTYKDTMGFEEPGIAEFTGSPPQFVLRPPKQRTLLVDVEVSFAETQDSTAPFDIEAYASFYETYTPTDTGVAVQTQRGLGGYLAQASGISGTNSNYNGVLCDSWSASLLSSIPSTFPTGLVRLKTKNDPYLTDVDGVQVFRRTAIEYTF